MRSLRLVPVAFLSVTLLLSACASAPKQDVDDTGAGSSVSSVSDDTAASSLAPATDTESATDGSPQASARTIQITAKNWEFSPKAITVKKGEKVSLAVKSVDGNHGIAIPELGIDQTYNQGETVTIDLPTDKTGTFQFRCSVPCGPGHREMTGTITIEA